MKRSYAVILAILTVLFWLDAGSAGAQSDEICFECHNDPELVGSAGDTIYVDSEKYFESVHAQAGLECVSCHFDLAGYEDWPHAHRLEKTDCSLCHDEAYELWDAGVHGESAREKGDLDAAACADCHGKHYILPVGDVKSLVYPSNLPQTCLTCHGDPKLADKHEGMGSSDIARMYLESSHGQALQKSGLVVSANCTSCHGSHKVLRLDEMLPQIPQICGECHAPIYQDYLQGVHGEAYETGNQDVPLCTDCHGEHNIRGPDDPGSTVSPAQVAENCAKCHEDMSLSSKYGLPTDRLGSFLNTYHGIALNLGDVRVANCASCHGFHNIRPSSDPESTIHPANLAETCGNCHPNAGENFAEGKIHIQDSLEDNIGAWLVKRLYVLLIAGLIGGFIAYIMVDLVAHRRRRIEKQRNSSDRPEDS
jgi:predicted CXXCH cytochrome family protein